MPAPPDLVDHAVLLSARSPVPPGSIDPAALRGSARLAYQVPIARSPAGPVKTAWFRLMGTALGHWRGCAAGLRAVCRNPFAQPAQIRASTLLYRQFLTRELPPLIGGHYRGRRVTVPVRFLVGTAACSSMTRWSRRHAGRGVLRG